MCVALLLAAVLTGPALADWTTPVLVESGINTQFAEWNPYLSYDGLSLYFARGYPDTFSIFEAKRSQPSGQFTSVSEVLSSSGHVLAPWVSQDNLRMYYHDESEGWSIKVSQRASVNDPWPEGTTVNLDSISDPIRPSLSSNELIMVFDRFDTAGGRNIYMATRPDKNSTFGNIRSLTEINTAAAEADPFLSPDGLSIYYDDIDSGGIYKATRQSLNDNDPFGNVQRLTFLDMPGRHSYHPAISSDGMAIYFASSLDSLPYADIYVSYNVPEPATLFLLGIGGVLLRRSRR